MQRIAPGARWPGRWATLSVPQPLTREQIEQTALLLLQRHGVLTRDCLSGEELGCTWSELYEVLQTLELRGQIRRGYFVRGLAGAQFALPDAYDTLRNTELALELETSLVLANACDPALVPGVAPEVGLPALPRLAGNYAVFFRGAIVLTYQHGASEWQFDAAQGEGIAARAVELLREHLTAEGGLCSQPRRLRIAQWNGAPPLDQPIQLVLETLGFRRDTPAMVWDGR